MHHFSAKTADKRAPPNLTAHPHARANAQGFLVRRVKVDEAQHTAVAAVVHRHPQLPARLEGDFAVGHLGLDLNHVAVPRVSQPGDAGFILVTQRQVQRQIDVTAQAEFFERFLGVGLGRRFGRGRVCGPGCSRGHFGGRSTGDGAGRHGTIVPS